MTKRPTSPAMIYDRGQRLAEVHEPPPPPKGKKPPVKPRTKPVIVKVEGPDLDAAELSLIRDLRKIAGEHR